MLVSIDTVEGSAVAFDVGASDWGGGKVSAPRVPQAQRSMGMSRTVSVIGRRIGVTVNGKNGSTG